MNRTECVESIGQLHRKMGLTSPKHPMISVINFEQTGTCVFDPALSYELGFYIITMKYNLRGNFLYGRQSYDFDDGTMLFMEPGQTVASEYSSKLDITEGWGLFFHPDLLKMSSLSDGFSRYPFFRYDVNEALHISDDEKKEIRSIVDRIVVEYSKNQDNYSQRLILSNLELLLNYCERYYGRQFLTRRHQNIDTVDRLDRFLNEYIGSEQIIRNGLPSVRLCAEQVFLSPDYLSELLKNEIGLNTQDYIHCRILERAIKRLLNSEQSVKEISASLGFDTSQYFSKLFKKKTGLTPTEFRSQSVS